VELDGTAENPTWPSTDVMTGAEKRDWHPPCLGYPWGTVARSSTDSTGAPAAAPEQEAEPIQQSNTEYICPVTESHGTEMHAICAKQGLSFSSLMNPITFPMLPPGAKMPTDFFSKQDASLNLKQEQVYIYI
jgi:hypothetical protein